VTVQRFCFTRFLLQQTYRFVGTSLLRYGGTQKTRTLDGPRVEHQTRMVGAVARRIYAPLHLVAHSLGGTIALTTALANVADIKSIATVEASPGFYCATRARHMRKCWRSAITLKPPLTLENATPQGELLIIRAVKDLSTPCRTQRKTIAVRRRAQTFWTGSRLKPPISIQKTWLS
jgi:pimeloyl-ACP methyl ester carboxylesterase